LPRLVGSRLARYPGRVEHWRADLRWRVTSRTLSIARWGHNSTIATSPVPPYDSVRWLFASTAPSRGASPSTMPCPRSHHGKAPSPYILGGRAVCHGLRCLWALLRNRLALSTSPPRATPATTSPHGPFAPEGFWCPLHPRFPARSARLGRTAGLPKDIGIPGGRARRLGLGCGRALPCFESALRPHVPSPLRREENQGPHPRSDPAPMAFLRA